MIKRIIAGIKKLMAGAVLALALTLLAHLLRSNVGGTFQSICDGIMASGEWVVSVLWGDSSDAPDVDLYFTLMVNGLMGVGLGMVFAIFSKPDDEDSKSKKKK